MPKSKRVKPTMGEERIAPANSGVTVEPDGRIQPSDGEPRVTHLERDTSERDATVSGPATGAVVGAGLGAVVGGPIGAVVGAVAGGAAGKLAEEANREDPNVPTGNPTDADSHRVVNDYMSGQVYEKGSLADVPVKRGDDIHAADEPDGAGHTRTDRTDKVHRAA
ncbi:MAG TPA: hypothetical protein VFN74_08780 [Chloroflexota bacterium]|nr:hypothetical protein [Chloroflexota bacterium]